MRVLVRASFDESRRALREPSVYRDLVEQGIPVSPKRVARLMQEDGLKRGPQALQDDDDERPRSTSRSHLLDRQFDAKHPTNAGGGQRNS